MFNRITGDTIEFQIILKDNGGTAITSGTGTLNVFDSSGSQVVTNSVATHFGTGTYQKQQSSAGWNSGPVTEQWKFVGAFGTLSFVQNNNYRIIGTDTITPYIYPEELKNYYENIEDYFDGNEEAVVVDAYNEVNSRLESLGVKLPFVVKADGLYDQPLRDMNAFEALYRLTSKRQASFNRDGEKEPWFFYFKQQAGSLYKNVEKKAYAFTREYSPAEGGIGLATKVAGTRPAQMETNWRGGIGEGFSDSTYDRTWVVKVTGTGTAGEIGEATFVWSKNGGLSYDGTLFSSLDYQHLDLGVYVRFHLGTYTAGTATLFAVNDKWQFQTFPRSQTSGGKNAALSY